MYHNPLQLSQVPTLPLDVDAMLFEMSVAKSQTPYQAPGGQPAYRQNLTRVTKPSSAGSSPQYPQRRRTSSSHRMSKYRPELHPHAIQALQRGIMNLQDQPSQHSRARPMSWHPSTMAALGSRPSSYVGSNDLSFRYSLNDYSYACSYHTVAVNGMPTPMTQPDMNVDLPVEPYFNLDDQTNFSSVMEQQSIHGFDAGGIVDPLLQQGTPADQSSLYTMSTLSVTEAFPAFSPAASQTQTWTDTHYTVSTQTAPPTPDVLPIQKPSDLIDAMKDHDDGDDHDHDHDAVPNLSPLDRKDSTELIGMGLYDDHDQGMRSASRLLGASFTSNTQMESTGKGLKLEETWEPPEDDDTSDEEDYEDDGDNENEGDENIEEVMQRKQEIEDVGSEQRPKSNANDLVDADSVILQGDMSDKSFFFDSGYTNLVGEGTGPPMSLLMQGVQQQVLLGGACM